MLRRYETLILARTQITADELSMIESFFEKISSEAKGKVVSFDRWGKYRLAYPIKKNDYGIYLLVRYEFLEKECQFMFKKLLDFFKINCSEIVMRYVTIKLDEKAPLAYKYPEPVDAGRTGSLDSFLKENKMESFLDNVDTSSKKDIKLNKNEEVKINIENISDEKKTVSEEINNTLREIDDLKDKES